VGEINAKMRRYYSEVLKKKGVKGLKPPGWSSRKIREYLPKFFCNRSVVENKDLVFRFSKTPGWFLQRLASRYTLFQMGFDQEIHDEVMREVYHRVVSEYGEGFEGIEQEYGETHRLEVYS
jgi:hypothetical protein